MAEDIYAKPDLTKKVRFQTGEKEHRNAFECDDIDDVRIYDNYWAEGSTPPKSQDISTEDQQQTTSVSVGSRKRNPLRAAAVFLGLLCLLLLAAVIVLVVLLIQDKSNWNMERHQQWVDNAKLTSERDKLQRSYSEMESLNRYLTRKTSQLENEKDLLNATNYNLTKERNELQKHIETTTCPADWIKFGDSCYSMSTSKKNWNDSRKVCEGLDAQLVIISSNEEQIFISSFKENTWIGLTDEETEDVWKWVNGTEASTTYWRTGQPDNYAENENCVRIVDTPLPSWNDLICTYLSHFICEKILK